MVQLNCGEPYCSCDAIETCQSASIADRKDRLAVEEAAASHPKVENDVVTRTVFREIRNRSCIAATLGARSAPKLCPKCGHRLYFVSHKIKIKLTDKGPARTG
jgi:hypothetical protein